MKKILIVFGTRPEAIKMVPVVRAFRNYNNLETKVCVTAQHREMLDQVVDFFKVDIDYDLDLMKPNQNLHNLTSEILVGLRSVLKEYSPDLVLVHGDTTTSMAGALAAFYEGIKVGHVEAGLRTYNKHAPFPEEINRQLTGKIADFHFAPTDGSKTNLLSESIAESHIVVTGNTVIDALLLCNQFLEGFTNESIDTLEKSIDFSKKVVLVTGHRRENHGQGFQNICEALIELSKDKDNEIVYPVHLNPNVRKPVLKYLKDISNVKLIEPLAYESFVWLMNKSKIIITDSGGIQEEAPSLGKPVLVMRETTERPEAVEAGTVILVGTDKNKIVSEANKLLNNEEYYSSMSSRHNPYGDGKASARIVDFVKNNL